MRWKNGSAHPSPIIYREFTVLQIWVPVCYSKENRTRSGRFHQRKPESLHARSTAALDHFYRLLLPCACEAEQDAIYEKKPWREDVHFFKASSFRLGLPGEANSRSIDPNWAEGCAKPSPRPATVVSDESFVETYISCFSAQG